MWKGIGFGALVVGILDIAEVIVFYAVWRDVKPLRILQGVAAGLLGRDPAFMGGTRTALIGLLIHFCIAFVVVAIYHLAAAKISALWRYPLVMGVLYGLAVYAVMNFAILPLTPGGPPRLSPWPVVANGLFAHVFCVGIPTALTARSARPDSGG